MNSALQLLSWDTEFLGYRVGRLHAEVVTAPIIQGLLEEARSLDFRLLYWSVSPNDKMANYTAQLIGAYLADRKITYVMPITSALTVLPEGVETTSKLSSQLVSLALQSGHQSRYQNDPGFADDVFERLYTQWIENSVNGKIAREALIYRSNQLPDELGLITLGTKQGRVDIGLLAVDERMRGQEIGSQLVDAAKQRARAWGFGVLQVVTQVSNIGACRFYERCGFTTDSLEHIYHVWLPRG